MLYPTEDQLIDGTGVRARGLRSKRRMSVFPAVGTDDFGDNHMYGKFSADTVVRGHKDSKNTALTVEMGSVHTLRHANRNNRNEGDATRHMGMNAFSHNPVSREQFDYSYISAIKPSNKPTEKLSDVIIQHTPGVPLNAIDIDNFQHGGTRTDAVRGTMIGAGNSLPIDNLDGTNINNSYGLHYAIDVGPGHNIGQLKQKELMQHMSNTRSGYAPARPNQQGPPSKP
jgi:hypothetical protein